MDRRQKLTKKKVAAALSRGGISWGRTVTTDATAASARARRSRRGVPIPAPDQQAWVDSASTASAIGFGRVLVQILPIRWPNCELKSKNLIP